jgi:hypothetical protein
MGSILIQEELFTGSVLHSPASEPSNLIPAVTYFPTPLPEQYRRRWGISLPCSGWERVGPPRSNHQEASINSVCTIFHDLARGKVG